MMFLFPFIEMLVTLTLVIVHVFLYIENKVFKFKSLSKGHTIKYYILDLYNQVFFLTFHYCLNMHTNFIYILLEIKYYIFMYVKVI